MNTFHKISLNICEQMKDNVNTPLYKIFFEIFASKKKYSIQEKYFFLKRKIIENIFLNEIMKDEFLELFQKIQQKFLCIQRFIFTIKYKKAKIVVENDLSLNPISENDKNVIVIYQNNNKYLFNIRDIIQLIEKSITHSEYFFSKPLICKNPYNNLILNKSTLYNIYFFMRFKTLYFSEILHHFFLCNFHLNEFHEKNYTLVRNTAIYDFFKNESSLHYLKRYILEMLDEYNDMYTFNKIEIHHEFPLKKLVEIMKPYLKIYLISKYSLLNLEKVDAKILLHDKLLRLQENTPSFGRKICKFEYANQWLQEKKTMNFYFVDDHISFYEESNDEFLLSHSILKKE